MKKEKSYLNTTLFFLIFSILGSLFFAFFISAALNLPSPPVSPPIGSGNDNLVYPSGNITTNPAPTSTGTLTSMVNWPVIWISLGVIFVIIVIVLIYYYIKKSDLSK